eukprot:11147844-Heterocapsa_arctica.AAC.1
MEVDADALVLEHANAEDRPAIRCHTEDLPHESTVAQSEAHAPLAAHLDRSSISRDGHLLHHRLERLVRRELNRTNVRVGAGVHQDVGDPGPNDKAHVEPVHEWGRSTVPQEASPSGS